MKYIEIIQRHINNKNRKRLTNTDFSLITSNCTGGIVSHWLGLKFRSPFINLFLTNEEFVSAMEVFDDFISTPLTECTDSGKDYPVGVGYNGIKVYFMHYKSFSEANEKWQERKLRINKNNMCVWFSNFNGDYELLKRFDNLPIKNKIVFVNHPYPEFKSAVYLKGFEKLEGVGQIYRAKNVFGKRYLDDFDYISYFNSLNK